MYVITSRKKRSMPTVPNNVILHHLQQNFIQKGNINLGDSIITFYRLRTSYRGENAAEWKK